MEAETQKKAFEALKTGKSVVMDFSLTADIQDDAGGICGGEASILIDACPENNLGEFKKFQESILAEEGGILISFISKGGNGEIGIKRIWLSENKYSDYISIHFPFLDNHVHEALIQCIPLVVRDPDPESEKGSLSVFIEPIRPISHLVIVGAGHVGRALTHLARLLDFNVTVIDNRAEVAKKEFLPDAGEIIAGDIPLSLQNLSISSNTYIVIASQGHKHDAEALKTCIHKDTAYIGLMGSRRKIRLLKDNFIEQGWATLEDLDKIHAPVGIDISSETVQEIALSIAAELVKARHDKLTRIRKSGIWTLILAAGKSERMGKQKMLMPYQGSTIIETVVNKAVKSGSDHVIVVLGSHREEIREKILQLPVDIVVNESYNDGMLSSIHHGLEAVSRRASAFIIMLGDQPMIPEGIIDRLIEAYKRSAKKIIIPVFQGKKGHPVLIDLDFREEINHLNPDTGLRELMRSHAEDIYELKVDTPDILSDIDTIEDYYIETSKRKFS